METPTAISDDTPTAPAGSLVDIPTVLSAMERFGAFINRKQRRSDIAKLPVPEQVAQSIRTMARDLSSPDDRKDSLASEHAKAMLKNTRAKTDLALYMNTHGAIERLATLTSMAGVVDNRLLNVMELLKPNELVLLQKSIHLQSKEIAESLKASGTEQLDAFLHSLNPNKGESTKATLDNLNKLPTVSRDRITAALSSLVKKMESDPVPTHFVEEDKPKDDDSQLTLDIP